MTANIATSGNNGFPFGQVGDIYYAVNYWGVDLSQNNASGSWTVPCDVQISANCYSQPVEGSAQDTGSCTMCWRIPDEVVHGGVADAPGTTSHVHAYPFQLFGSLGGRKETHGVPCGNTSTLAGSGRCGDAVYDMRDPNAAIGLPERVDRIGDLSFCFDIQKECSGTSSNIENVFIDTYLHRIYQPDLYPDGHSGSDGVPGNWDDVNKINENATETWNLNFKLCLPEFSGGADPGAQATGGVRINQTPITIDGKDWGVYFKWENFSGNGSAAVRDINTGLAPGGKCINSFFYISFVPWSAATGLDRGICNQNNVCCNYKAFLDWVSSQEFKDRVLGQNGQPLVPADRQGSGAQSHWPLWVWNAVGQPRFIIDDPDGYVLDGIMLGNELWYSPTNTESCVCWENVSFTSNRGTFGKTTNLVQENCINCNTSTLPAQTFQTGAPHSFLINLQDTTGAPLTTAPIITPNTYINSVTNQGSGNFLVTVTVPTGQQGVYPLVINNGIAGCTDCQLILNAQQIVIPVCTTTTATATVRSVVSTPCAITFSNPTPKAGETITATACNCAGYTFSNWTSTPEGAVINGNTATYTVPFGAVAGSTEQFSAVCCEV